MPADGPDRHGEQQNNEAEMHLLRPLQISRLQREQQLYSQIADGDGQQAAEEADQQPFDDHLRNQPAAARAKRFAQGQLFLPGHGARQHQVG